jgi:hypothetical protein
MNATHAMPLLRDGVVATVMFGIGFAPITALALSLMEVCTLPFATLALVLPALAMALGLGCFRRSHGRLMGRGFLMGIASVACYDGVRIPFIIAGWLDDFIPRIGVMLVGEGHHHATAGYLWRYLGNGGGMGMAFVSAFTLLQPHMFPLQKARVTSRVTKQIAVGFGICVWACLIATLTGEEVMFGITPLTLLLSLIGHLVFGYTLGCLAARSSDSLRICTPTERQFHTVRKQPGKA